MLGHVGQLGHEKLTSIKKIEQSVQMKVDFLKRFSM